MNKCKQAHRDKNKANRSKIPKRRGIEERPLSVDQRLEYGDWEGDLICGKSGSGYIVSLLERKSRHCLLAYVQDKKRELVSQAIIKMLQPFSAKSLTVDNGLEFASHQKIQKELGLCVYFCRPYSSHEKGAVENLNGLVRQYYPKGSSFDNVEASLSKVVEEINDRPRKIL